MPWTADGKWIPEDDSVATRLTGLLASDSSYIATARAAGQRTGHKRGLLNSSIAGGAAESAAIAAAAPIASQDASQTFRRNQAVLEGGISYDNSSRLQEEQIAGQRDLNAQQNQFTAGRDEFNANAQRERDTFLTNAERERDLLIQNGANAQQMRDFEQRTAEQVRQLSSQERQAAHSADTSILQTQINANSQLSGQYLQAFANLANDSNVPAATRNAYIAEFQRVMENGQRLINVMRNTPLTWGPAGIAPAAAGATA